MSFCIYFHFIFLLSLFFGRLSIFSYLCSHLSFKLYLFFCSLLPQNDTFGSIFVLFFPVYFLYLIFYSNFTLPINLLFVVFLFLSSFSFFWFQFSFQTIKKCSQKISKMSNSFYGFHLFTGGNFNFLVFISFFFFYFVLLLFPSLFIFIFFLFILFILLSFRIIFFISFLVK